MVAYYISFVTFVAGLLWVVGYSSIQPVVIIYFLSGILVGSVSRRFGAREDALLWLSWLPILPLRLAPLPLQPMLWCAAFLGLGSAVSLVRWHESLREHLIQLFTFFSERPFIVGASLILVALYFGELIAPILAIALVFLIRKRFSNQLTLRIVGVLGVIFLLLTVGFYLVQVAHLEVEHAVTHWIIQRSLIGWTASLFAVCFLFATTGTKNDAE